MSNLAAKFKDVTFLLVNCQPSLKKEALDAFASKNKVVEPLQHMQLVKDKSPYSGYYPYHCVIKDGVCVLNGGFDMSAKKWKDWEGVAGLK